MFSEFTDQVRRVREQLDNFEHGLTIAGGFGEGPEWVAGGLAEMKRLLTMLGQPPPPKPPKPPKWAYYRKKKKAA